MTDPKEKPSLLIISHSYANFVKDQVNEMAPHFRTIFVLVRTNPLAEISKIIPVSYLAPFSVAQKIDLRNKPENVHVFQTPVLYLPTESGYKKLGRDHLKAVEKVIQRHSLKFDMIHAHFTWSAGYVGSKLKEKYAVPLIITAHGMDIYDLPFRNTFYRNTISTLLNSADHIITVSANNVRCIQELVVKKPVSVIFNGYDDTVFYPVDPGDCRNKLGLPQDKKIIVHVARLYDVVKGHEILIRALQEVIKKREDVVCYIVGDGALRPSLEKLISALKLDHCIKIVGAKPHHEIPLWINACDLFVLPSLNEGNPVVMVECLGCGKPFIGTCVGAIPEIIISDSLGILSKPGNVHELGNNILMALNRKWDHEAILTYGRKFTWKEIAKEIISVYTLFEPKNT
jgi:glycosyltransferase involved in cell wall biosynthesis